MRGRIRVKLGKTVALAVMVFFVAAQICLAATNYTEITYPTGNYWYVVGDGVTYDVSNTDVAKVVNKDGRVCVLLKRPGDVYITVRHNRGVEGTYLVHVTGSPVDETAVNRGTFARDVLNLVNKERVQRRLQPLTLADDLMRAAAARATEIPRRFAHERPNGLPFYSVIVHGQGTLLGENIAGGQISPEAVVRDWMNSPGHRANILNEKYRELGVGYYYNPDSEFKHYWTQMFRRR